jgi:exodeoxyribonuclease VII large subunit
MEVVRLFHIRSDSPRFPSARASMPVEVPPMSIMSRFPGADDPFGLVFESVTELTGRIKETLTSQFGEVALHGEVSNVARPKSGHIYFTLKDDAASIRAVIWKSSAQRLPFELTDGLAVRAIGDVTVYEPRGEYQIVVRLLEPEGVGPLELAFRQRFARLAAEGLFDPNRKRPLPRFPRRIVVVASPTGAAVRDVLQVTGRRWKGAEILVAPTRVQGEGADREVVAAMAMANQVAGADIIIIARGGGSLEDLWTFNEEAVARAIAGSHVPVVSAIGHEIDVTLADLAADRRALTPSEAGEICVPDSREIALHLDRLADRLRSAGQAHLVDARGRLDRLADRSRHSLRQLLDARRLRLTRLAASLDALSPLAVLARGYSLTLNQEDTSLIRSSDQVQPGQLIVTRLANGQITSRVESIP